MEYECLSKEFILEIEDELPNEILTHVQSTASKESRRITVDKTFQDVLDAKVQRYYPSGFTFVEQHSYKQGTSKDIPFSEIKDTLFKGVLSNEGMNDIPQKVCMSKMLLIKDGQIKGILTLKLAKHQS